MTKTNYRVSLITMVALLGVAMLMLTGCEKKAAVQGVTDTEIVLGVHTPLSGPVSLWGIPATNGQRMRVDEINEAGGIHGRKIRLIVEDNGYQQSKAAQAGDKLLQKDKVFALIGVLGTPMNMVTMDKAISAGVPNLFPITAAKEMYEPLHKYKFGAYVPYYDQMRAAVKYFVEEKGKKRIAVMYQDDDFGKNVYNGAKDQTEAMGLKLVEETTYKRGSKDFSSQIAKMKAADADFIVLGTIISETIGAKVEALKLGWKVDMIVTSAGYTTEVAELSKGAASGLYGAGQTAMPYEDTATGELKDWIERHKAKFGKAPVLQTTAGYTGMDLFIKAADMAGKDLTADKLSAALESIKDYTTFFGGEPYSFSENDHLGPPDKSGILLNQIQGMRWVSVTTIGY